MESWVVGYGGDEDVERHAGADGEAARRDKPSGLSGGALPLRLRVVSDYI